MSKDRGSQKIPSNDSASLCRVCQAIMDPWPEKWLDFHWGTCTSCGSVQKLIDKREFESLTPSYDPGFLDYSTDVDALQKSMGVDEKYRLLRNLLGADSRGSLLDIGCGMGGFLLAGRRLGMEVSGVEPSLSHSKAAVEIFGLNVVGAYFDSRNFDKKFDVVVLSHVIEHVFEPGAFLADVMQVLRPGGRLIVITPNCGSLSASMCGKYWSMYKPVDHVTMLTKKAITRVIPLDSSIVELTTSEWPGEFGAHLISGVKTAIKPSLSNVESRGLKGSVRQSNLGSLVRFPLGVASLPFFMLGFVFDRQSCIYAVIQKKR